MSENKQTCGSCCGRKPEGELHQVKSEWFTAGIIVRDGQIIWAAPILSWVRIWNFEEFKKFCEKKGWTCI